LGVFVTYGNRISIDTPALLLIFLEEMMFTDSLTILSCLVRM